MTKDDVLVLAKAGFNVQQIMALAQVTTPVQATTPATVPAQATTPATVPALATTPATVTAPATTPATVPAPAISLDPVIQQIQQLTGALQANALINSNMPTQQSADDILASIIAPPINDKK